MAWQPMQRAIFAEMRVYGYPNGDTLFVHRRSNYAPRFEGKHVNNGQPENLTRRQAAAIIRQWRYVDTLPETGTTIKTQHTVGLLVGEDEVEVQVMDGDRVVGGGVFPKDVFDLYFKWSNQ